MSKGRLVTMLFVAIVAFGFFIWLTNVYVFDSSADVSKVNIVVTPESGDVPLTPVTFSFVPEDTDAVISGVDARITLEGATLTGWKGCKNPDSEDTQFNELISDTGTNPRHACVILESSTDLPHIITLPGSIQCTGDTPAKIKFESGTQVSGPVEGNEFTINELPEIELNCDGSTIDEDVSVTFEPTSCSTDVGGQCEYDLNVNSNGDVKKISGLYVKLAYDDSVLSISDESEVLGGSGTPTTTPTETPTDTPSPTEEPTPNPTEPVATPTATIAPTYAPNDTPIPTQSPSDTHATSTPTITPSSNTNPFDFEENCEVVATRKNAGEFEYIFTCDAVADNLPSEIQHKFVFDAIGNGEGELTVEAVQVVGPNIKGAYTVHKGKADYTIGGGSEDGDVKLNLKLRMQCIVKKPKRDIPIEVKVGLSDGPLGSKKIYKTGKFRFDDNGHLVGTVAFDVKPGAGYKVYVKTDTGMQKKVCSANPTEDFPAAYSCDRGEITLANGNNELDFSNIILLTGDLPPGEQNGVKNSQDYALVRTLIGKRDEESASVADINYDTVVNAVDHSCMIFDTRWDEE